MRNALDVSPEGLNNEAVHSTKMWFNEEGGKIVLGIKRVQLELNRQFVLRLNDKHKND